MDPLEGHAQGPTESNTRAVDPALGVGLDGDIAGSRDQGALVAGTGAAMGSDPARPAGEAFAASDDPSREASFAPGQSRGESGSTSFVQQQQGRFLSARPASGSGGGGVGSDDGGGDDDMADMADTVGLEWGVGRGDGDGGGGGDVKDGAVSASKGVGKGGSTPQGTSKIGRGQPLPELKQASPQATITNTGRGVPSPPTSRLQTPKVNRQSPSAARSRNSSICSSSPSSPPTAGLPGSLALHTSPAGSLSESLDTGVMGERTTPGGRRRVPVLNSPPAGVNFRAVSSPGSSASFSHAPQGERRKSVPAYGARGRGAGAGSRSPHSHGGSARTTPSPDAKRNSMSFGDFVAASNTELSLLESSRLSAGGGKRTRDRNALRVAVRVRPLIEREKGSRMVTCDGGSGRMVVVNPKKFKASADAVLATASAVSRANMATSDWLRPFDFDKVFWSPNESTPNEPSKGDGEDGSASVFSTQQSVYEGLGERIVEDVLNGVNCSCFAYGHTGSGKTYSMFGCSSDAVLQQEDAEALEAPPEGKAFGLVPRVCFHLLRRLHETSTGAPTHDPGTSSVGLSVQFIEIYNDKIRDLLHPGADSSAFRVREHPNTGPYVDNLVPVQVESWSQLRQLLVLGCSARTEADTPENSKSSRGHAILTLEVGTPAGLSRVQMVDLAGSEREMSTRGRGGSGNGGGDVGRRPLPQRLRETAQIKKALSNLGIIIKGLSKGSTPVGLPFRDSVLTWLLKEALSGRAHTTMLATISPSSNNYVETMNTLKYAERLRRASVHLNWNKDANGPPIGKPSDCIKEEMENLVKKLGADGVEAKRQVLYQTVSDPQQRIAKLTAKDPRRRRTSSGGSALPLGNPRQDLGLGPGPRRTSFPGFTGPATPQRFGWNPATPTRHIGDKPRSNSDRALDGAKAWGSPIVRADDLSMEGAAAGLGVGVGPGTPDNLSKPGGGVGSGGDDANVSGGALGTESAHMGGRAYQVGGTGTEGGGYGYGSDPKLYSDSSESEDDEESGGGGGGGEGGASRDGGYGDGGYGGGGGGDGVRDGFGDDGDDDAGDDVGEDIKDYVEEDDVDDYVDGATRVRADVVPAASAARNQSQGGNCMGDARQRLAEQAGEAAQGRNAGMSIATGGRREGDDDDAHTASTGEEHRHSWPPSPEGGTAPNWAGTSSSETSRSPGSEREIASNGEERAELPSAGGVGDTAAAAAVDVSNPLGSLTADASEPSDTASTGSEGRAWREAGDSALPTRRVGGARGSSAPPKRISWAEEQGDSQQQDREDGGDAEWEPQAEESDRHAGYRSAGVGVGAGHGGHHRTEGHASVHSRSDDQREPLGRGDSRPSEGVMNSSVESGGGEGGYADALAASGVFDTTGTSAKSEGNGDGASEGDADSLEGTGRAQGGAWTSQQQQRQQRQQIERRREREGRQRSASDDRSDHAGGGEANDDVSRIIEDLMRQIDQLKAANTALREEVQRLREELRRSKDSEEEAWAIGDDTSQEFRSRLASIQRQLDDQTARARDAERDAREADERAETVVESGPSDASRLLDEARRRTKEAEERAREAEAREEKLQARAKDAAARLEASQVALEERTAAAEEAKADARQSRATLEAAGGDVDVDSEVAAANRASDKERLKAVDAEARASREVAKAEELSALIDDQDERLARARKGLLEEGARADGAELRERRAEARAGELEGLLSDNEKRLARVREAFEAEGARADEAAEGRDAAERRVRELERDSERRQAELEQAKNEAEALLAAEIVAGGAEKKRAAARTDAVVAERDRGLEQIEAERTEVLRLSAALNGLRSTSRQELKAATDRETGLKAVLASESEASRAEQAEVEQLLSLIASAQGTEGGGSGGVDHPPAVSVSGARFAIEAQRAKHEAARRRLKTLEDENRALRRSKADNQAGSDRLRLVEEERDFLLREKDSLDERLQNLELRQQAFQQREKKAGHQEGKAGVAREKLEEELRDVEDQLSEEVALRSKEAMDFAGRLKEKDEQAAEQLSKTLKQVMDGVKSQAGHIRGTVAQLEEERDRAIGARNAAKSQVEDVRCQMGRMQTEKADAASEFDAQMQQSARERAALWLAVNKLDVLEAAKDAAIKDLQTEGENKSRAIKVLEAHNAGLTRELGQVDMSLMQALEDNGLTLDSVKLKNTPTSRRVSRRRLASHGRSSLTNGHTTGNPPPHPHHPGGARDAANPAINAHDGMSGKTRSIRSSAIQGAFAVDDVPPPSQRPPGGAVAGGRRDSARRQSSFHAPRAVDNRNSDYQDEEGEGEDVEVEEVEEEREEEEREAVVQGRHSRTGRRDSGGRQRNERNGHEFERGAAFENGHTARGVGERRRTYNGSASSSLHADSWDPAINTIEREIEQLSERLSGQPHHVNANSTARLRRASSQDDLPGEESFHGRDGREQGSVAKGMGVTSGTVGKRLRVRSSVVSPPKKTPSQVRKRERGGVV